MNRQIIIENYHKMEAYGDWSGYRIYYNKTEDEYENEQLNIMFYDIVNSLITGFPKHKDYELIKNDETEKIFAYYFSIGD